MTKGVRDFVAEKFLTTLPQFQSGEMSGTEFRKAVMTAAVNQFQITVASAATHYNFALKAARAADPSAVEGLGRPEDKKGGRKVIHTVTVVKVKTGEIVAEGISKERASLMITAAENTKGKAKLKIKEEEKPAEEVAAATA
jgi:hypothetical protein